MPESETRILFTVRAGEGTFRVVTSKAHEALGYIEELIERGLIDVNVIDLNGKRYDLDELRGLGDAEMATGLST